MADVHTSQDNYTPEQRQAIKEKLTSPTSDQIEPDSLLTDAGEVATDMYRAISAFGYGVAEGMTTLPISYIQDFKPKDDMEMSMLGIGNLIGFAPRMVFSGTGSISKGMADVMRTRLKSEALLDAGKGASKVLRSAKESEPTVRKILQEHASGKRGAPERIAETLDRFGNFSNRMAQNEALVSLPEYVGKKGEEVIQRFTRMDNYGKSLRRKSTKVSGFIKRHTGKDVHPGLLEDLVRGAASYSLMWGASSNPATSLGTRDTSDMAKSMMLGAFFGMGDRAIGSLMEDSPVLLKGIAGSIANGSLSTIEGAPNSQQVMDYLTGFFFGAGEEPWHYRQAMQAHGEINNYLRHSGQDVSDLDHMARTGKVTDPNISEIMVNNGFREKGRYDGKPVDPIVQSFRKLLPQQHVLNDDGVAQTILSTVNQEFELDPFKVVKNLEFDNVQTGGIGKSTALITPDARGIMRLDGEYQRETGQSLFFGPNELQQVKAMDNKQASAKYGNFLGWSPKTGSAQAKWLKQKYNTVSEPYFINLDSAKRYFQSKDDQGNPMYEQPVTEDWGGKVHKHVAGAREFLKGSDAEPSLSDYITYLNYHEMMHQQGLPELLADAASYLHMGFNSAYTRDKATDIKTFFDRDLNMAHDDGRPINMWNEIIRASLPDPQGNQTMLVNPARYGYKTGNDARKLGVLEKMFFQRKKMSDQIPDGEMDNTRYSYLPDESGGFSFQPASHRKNYDQGRVMISKIKDGNADIEVRDFGKMGWTTFTFDPMNNKEITIPEQLLTDRDIAQTLDSLDQKYSGTERQLRAKKLGRKFAMIEGASVDAVRRELEQTGLGIGDAFEYFKKGFISSAESGQYPRVGSNMVKFKGVDTVNPDEALRMDKVASQEEMLIEEGERVFTQDEDNIVAGEEAYGFLGKATSERELKGSDRKNWSPDKERSETEQIRRNYSLEQNRFLDMLSQIIGEKATFMKFAKPSYKRYFEMLTGNRSLDNAPENFSQLVAQSAKKVGAKTNSDGYFSDNDAVRIVKDLPIEFSKSKDYRSDQIDKTSAWWKKKDFENEFSSTAFATKFPFDGGSRSDMTYHQRRKEADRMLDSLSRLTETFTQSDTVGEAVRVLSDNVGDIVRQAVRHRGMKNIETIRSHSKDEIKKFLSKRMQGNLDQPVVERLSEALTGKGSMVDGIIERFKESSKKDSLPSFEIKTTTSEGTKIRSLINTRDGENVQDTISWALATLDTITPESNKKAYANAARSIRNYYNALSSQTRTTKVQEQFSTMLRKDQDYVADTYGKDSNAYKEVKKHTGELMPLDQSGKRHSDQSIIEFEMKNKLKSYVNTLVDPSALTLPNFLRGHERILGFRVPMDSEKNLRLLTDIYADEVQKIDHGNKDGYQKAVYISRTPSGIIVENIDSMPTINETGSIVDNSEFKGAYSDQKNTIQISAIHSQKVDTDFFDPGMEMIESYMDTHSEEFQSQFDKISYSDLYGKEQLEFINKVEQSLGEDWVFIGSKSDNDKLIFYKPEMNSREFGDAINDYLGKLDERVFNDNESMADAFMAVERIAKTNNRTNTEKALVEFFYKNLPENPEALLTYIGDEANLIKRLQIIGTEGKRQVQQNWNQETNDWRKDSNWKETAERIKKVDNERAFFRDGDTQKKVYSDDPYSKLTTAFVMDPKGNIGDNYAYSRDLVNSFPDEPYDGIIYLSDDAFDNYLAGKYSSVNETGHLEDTDFIKAFYKDGKYLFKAGFARAPGSVKEMMRKEGLDQLVFTTSEKTGIMNKDAASLIEDGNGSLSLQSDNDRYLSWTDPMGYYHKNVGHDVHAKNYKQLIGMTDFGGDRLKDDVMKRATHSNHFFARLMNPDVMEAMVAGSKREMSEMPWDDQDTMEEFLSDWDQTAEIYGWDSVFGLLSQQLGGGTKMQVKNRIIGETLAQRRAGKTQYLIPKVASDAKHKRRKISANIFGRAEQMGATITDKNRSDIEKLLTWDKNKVILGSSMAEANSGYDNIALSNAQKFDQWTQRAASAIAKGEAVPELPKAYMVRSPIASIPTITPVEIIGYDRKTPSSYIHPENVKIIKGDHDGDKVLMVTDVDNSLLKFIQDPEWQFPADILDYQVTKSYKESDLKPELPGLDAGLRKKTTSGILTGKKMIGIIANANLYRHMLIQQARNSGNEGAIEVFNKQFDEPLRAGKNKIKSIDAEIFPKTPERGYVTAQKMDKMLKGWRSDNSDASIKDRVDAYNADKGYNDGDVGFMRYNESEDRLELLANDVPGAMIDLSLNSATDASKSGGFKDQNDLAENLWQYIFDADFTATLEGGKVVKSKDMSVSEKAQYLSALYGETLTSRLYKDQNVIHDGEQQGASLPIDDWFTKLGEFQDNVNKYLEHNGMTLEQMPFITRGIMTMRKPKEDVFSRYDEGSRQIIPGTMSKRMLEMYGKEARDHFRSKVNDMLDEVPKEALETREKFAQYVQNKLDVNKPDELSRFIREFYLGSQKKAEDVNTPVSMMYNLLGKAGNKDIFNSEDKYALNAQVINGFDALRKAVLDFKRSGADTNKLMDSINELVSRTEDYVEARDMLKKTQNPEWKQKFKTIQDNNAGWLNSKVGGPHEDIIKALTYVGIPINKGKRFTRDMWRNKMAKMFISEGRGDSVPVRMGLDFKAIQGASTPDSFTPDGNDSFRSSFRGSEDGSETGGSTSSFTEFDSVNKSTKNTIKNIMSASDIQLGDVQYGTENRKAYVDDILYGNDNSYTPNLLQGLGKKHLANTMRRLENLFDTYPELKDDWMNWVDHKLDGKINNTDQLSALVDYLYKIKNKPLMEHPAYKNAFRQMFQSYYGIDEEAERLLTAGYEWTPITKDPTSKRKSAFNTVMNKNGFAQQPLSVMGKLKSFADANRESKVADLNKWSENLVSGKYVDHKLYLNINRTNTPEKVGELNDIITRMINGGYRYNPEGSGIVKLDLANVYKDDPLAYHIYSTNLNERSREIAEYRNKSGKEWDYVTNMVEGLTKYLDDFYDQYITSELMPASKQASQVKADYYMKKYDQTGNQLWLDKAKRQRAVNPERLQAYFPHRWDSIPELEQGLYQTLDYIDSAPMTMQQKKQYKAKVMKTVDMIRKEHENQGYSDPFVNTTEERQNLRGRELHVQGFRSDNPFEIIKLYTDSMVKQKNNYETSAKIMEEYSKFEDGDSYKLAKEDLGGKENRTLWLDAIQNYIKDNLDIYGSRSRSPHVKLYFDKMLNTLTGGLYKMSNDPEDYWFDHGDEAMHGRITKLKKRLTGKDDATVSKRLMPDLSVAEGKWRLMSLLAHPKAGLNNIFGAGMNTVIRAGTSIMRDGMRLKKQQPERFQKMYHQAGVSQDMMDFEFKMMMSTKPSRDRGVHALKAWTENMKIYSELIPLRYSKPDKANEKKVKRRVNKLRAQIKKNNRAFNVDSIIDDFGGGIMSKTEQWARETAFAAGFQKAKRMGYDEDSAIAFAKRFTMNTQFSYSNANRMEKDRSSVGRILSRFKQYRYEAFREHKRLFHEAKLAGWDPSSMSSQNAWRMISIMVMMMSAASMLPYSMFELAMPPHVSDAKDFAEMLFSEEPERYFFHTYGLSMPTSPTSSLVLKPLQAHVVGMMGNTDYDRWATREAYYQLPFGRALYSMKNIYENGLQYLPHELGFPQKQLMYMKHGIKK